MRLETAEIDRYGPLKGCHPPCDDRITVVAGPNESGKTLYLEGILQLLEPGVAEYMNGGPRVDGTPAGRVVVDDGTERHVLGDGTRLSDVSRVEPRHLHNLFVVRDSDLVLPEGPDYYTTLVEHLGDIHTSEIEAIRQELLDDGRLTPSDLDLRDRKGERVEEEKSKAESLASDIESYLQSVEEQGISETVRERLRLQSELSTVESSLEIQRTAGELTDFRRAKAQYEEYVDATEKIHSLSTFDEETLEQLRDRERELSRTADRIEEIERLQDEQRQERETCREELSTARNRHRELQQREVDIEEVDAALESYRNQSSSRVGDGFDSRLVQRRYVTVAGLVGAGLAAGGGVIAGSGAAILLAISLLGVALAAGVSHYRLSNQIANLEEQEREILVQARDAGFEVESVDEIAPRVREYWDELERAQSQVHRLEARLEQTEERVDELEDELETAESRVETLRGQLTAALEDDGADSVEEYASRVETKAEHEQRRTEAALFLENELDAPGVDDPEEKIALWKSALGEWEAEIGETDVTAEAYDEDELERLEARREQLKSRLQTLEDELSNYEAELDKFENRANKLSPPPFVDVDPSLEAGTEAGLRSLVEDLYTMVETIDRNAEISRKAIGIFDDIRDDEEGKVATLFDPDGPASEIFATLTDGRYEAVDYDPDAETLAVTAADGATLTPRQLSRGTRDQLYFAARLSLAEQLLDGGAGFLLLDDPFLAADRARLRNGFETLQGLCEDGWQVVYLTAKPEVHEEMATEFDCTVHELELLEF